MAASDFIGEVIVSLVLLDGTAKRSACLHPGIGRVRNGTEWIHCLEIAVAQESEDVAMKVVRSRARDDIQHPAGGASIFSCITVGNDLKLLHGLLRYSGAD